MLTDLEPGACAVARRVCRDRTCSSAATVITPNRVEAMALAGMALGRVRRSPIGSLRPIA